MQYVNWWKDLLFVTSVTSQKNVHSCPCFFNAVVQSKHRRDQFRIIRNSFDFYLMFLFRRLDMFAIAFLMFVYYLWIYMRKHQYFFGKCRYLKRNEACIYNNPVLQIDYAVCWECLFFILKHRYYRKAWYMKTVLKNYCYNVNSPLIQWNLPIADMP